MYFVANFIRFLAEKKSENRLRFDKVRADYKVALFMWTRCMNCTPIRILQHTENIVFTYCTMMFRWRRGLIFVEPGLRWAHSPSSTRAPGIPYQGTMKTSMRMLKTSGVFNCYMRNFAGVQKRFTPDSSSNCPIVAAVA